ncbi:unnamed protein product [Acanthoscelides obtectus]|uniref:Uncharacterized protein n=1 Tax=Acanthoscelides obtectus TaxID=200917 RepID=A0A9P0PDK1_ACAOB|nr:unnamed protein product [Acanthoscelides obtectus]CAK1665004.1 hypothetical protein AOBTE_LOCUS24603 [Acanthoscelides obtectus]
MFNRIRPH